MTDTLKALDDLGELLDQLAGNAREFDFHATNRMERDAAKALLVIEAAVNALPGLLAERDRMREALEEIAAHYNGGITGPGRMQADSMREIARAALGEKP